MKYGFSVIVRGEEATPDTFVALAERAEAPEAAREDAPPTDAAAPLYEIL